MGYNFLKFLATVKGCTAYTLNSASYFNGLKKFAVVKSIVPNGSYCVWNNNAFEAAM